MPRAPATARLLRGERDGLRDVAALVAVELGRRPLDHEGPAAHGFLLDGSVHVDERAVEEQRQVHHLVVGRGARRGADGAGLEELRERDDGHGDPPRALRPRVGVADDLFRERRALRRAGGDEAVDVGLHLGEGLGRVPAIEGAADGREAQRVVGAGQDDGQASQDDAKAHNQHVVVVMIPSPAETELARRHARFLVRRRTAGAVHHYRAIGSSAGPPGRWRPGASSGSPLEEREVLFDIFTRFQRSDAWREWATPRRDRRGSWS